MNSFTRELRKIASLSLFFLVGFGYILLLMKLFLEDYSITLYIFSKALIGSVVAAKSVLIMDATPIMREFRRSPRYVAVLYKTSIYTLAVFVIGFLEKLIHTYQETKEFKSAIIKIFESATFHHTLGVILCVGIVFLIYNILKEIDSLEGNGTIQRVFFSRPRE
jgi:hypothetical protein